MVDPSNYAVFPSARVSQRRDYLRCVHYDVAAYGTLNDCANNLEPGWPRIQRQSHIVYTPHREHYHVGRRHDNGDEILVRGDTVHDGA